MKKLIIQIFFFENGYHVLIKDENFEYFVWKSYFQTQFRNVVI